VGHQHARDAARRALINRFDYDGDYGTVLNRFLMQAAVGYPLTVHGTGGQTRAFIHIRDTVRCIQLAIEHPPERGERVRILNQMTETHRVRELAQMISDMTGAEIRTPAPWFDPVLYRTTYPEVSGEGPEPFLHYVRHGRSHERQPGAAQAEVVLLDAALADEIRPFFDAEHYANEWGDLTDVEFDLPLHYIRHGAAEGRTPAPWFDPVLYRTTYPEVSGEGPEPFLHYVRHGRSHERQPGAAQAEVVLLDAALADEIRPFFDAEHYANEWGDLTDVEFDLPLHYVRHGAAQGRTPAPWFDPVYYHKTYPDVAAEGPGPFLHYVRHGRSRGHHPSAAQAAATGLYHAEVSREAVRAAMSRRTEVVRRIASGDLARLVAAAAELDPLVAHRRRDLKKVVLPPFTGELGRAAAAIRILQAQSERRPAAAVVCIPHCRISGAARVAGELSHALSDLHGAANVVVVRTELRDLEHPEWFPPGVRHVDLASESADLSGVLRVRLLFQYLRALAPQIVVNVNSRLMWDASVRYGPAMAPCFRIFAYLFCSDLNADGVEAGYPVDMFYRTFDHLDGYITDSHSLADRLRDRFALAADDARLMVLPTPLRDPPPPVARPEANPDRRPTVFWAGRFDRQKRVDIVLKLATRMPDVDFRIWGRAVLDTGFDGVAVPGNAQLMGVYDNFRALPLDECDAWLFTSAWEGVPTILLDVAAAGIPLVASLVGGTGEVLAEGYCHRIEDIEDLAPFEAAIRAILSDPDQARVRALALRDLVVSQRTPEGYRAGVAALSGGSHEHA
jgi:glycosyltransferase involved in cell wall biosynthesis